MVVSEYIKELQKIQKEHGDIEVRQWFFGDTRIAIKPRVKFLKILTGRMTKNRTWESHDPKELRGNKIVDL